jgi:hypothetical protein
MHGLEGVQEETLKCRRQRTRRFFMRILSCMTGVQLCHASGCPTPGGRPRRRGHARAQVHHRQERAHREQRAHRERGRRGGGQPGGGRVCHQGRHRRRHQGHHHPGRHRHLSARAGGSARCARQREGPTVLAPEREEAGACSAVARVTAVLTALSVSGMGFATARQRRLSDNAESPGSTASTGGAAVHMSSMTCYGGAVGRLLASGAGTSCRARLRSSPGMSSKPADG